MKLVPFMFEGVQGAAEVHSKTCVFVLYMGVGGHYQSFVPELQLAVAKAAEGIVLPVETVIALAEKFAPQAEMKSSAELCIEDAKSCFAVAEKKQYARNRALNSLAYSVGRFSPVYKACAVFEDGEYQG